MWKGLCKNLMAVIDSYNGYGKWENFDEHYHTEAWKVTHWQPLPQDPKKEG